MTNRTLKLLPSELNGFRFYWESESETGGRKLVIREYPNSNERSIEDMGGLPQTFTINAVVAGANYLSDAKRFRNILIEGGEADLIVPNFGIHKVYIESYSRNTTQRQIGRISFSITVHLKEMTGLKGVDFVTDEDIYNGFLEANDALANALLEAWQKPITNENRLSAIKDTKSFLESAREVVKGINQATRQAERFLNMVDTAVLVAEMYADLLVREGIFAVLASLTGLGSSYQRLWDMIDFGKNLPNRFVQLVEVFGGVDFTDTKDWGIPAWDDLTPEWKQRNNNRVAMVESSRGACYIAMLADVPNGRYETAKELDERQGELQGFFEEIKENPESKIFNNQNFVEKLLELKEMSFQYLEQIRKTVFYEKEIDVYMFPPLILAHNLYAEKGREEIERMADKLKVLNDGKQVFEGQIKVLEKL